MANGDVNKAAGSPQLAKSKVPSRTAASRPLGATPAQEAPEPPPLVTSARAEKRPSASKGNASKARKTTGKKPTLEAIQLRAYYIAEARQKQGLPGTPESDWLEAERQLKLESRPSTASGKSATTRNSGKKSPAKTRKNGSEDLKPLSL